MSTQAQKAGQMAMATYASNMGGLNVTDSPFAIKPEQATNGFNYEYVKTGGFKKSLAPTTLSATTSALLLTRGYGLYNTKANIKSIIRMAGTGIESIDYTTGIATPVTDDSSLASGTAFNSNQGLAYSSMFVTPSSDVLWAASSTAAYPIGVYSTAKFTTNGSSPATGSFSAAVSATGGAWATVNTYWYAIALRKAGTQQLSNADLDVSATITNVTDSVILNFSGLGAIDTTKYDKIYIYRSSPGGSEDFTAGVLVNTINTNVTSYIDTGTSIVSSTPVPRPSNTSLDNSILPSGTYESLCVWKQRLVTASNSTVYLSDVNKPESWPTTNTINIPSGGKITAVANIGYNHPGGSSTDEFLAVFKENELWLITGSSYTDWELKFVDYAGTPQQGLIANANGFLSWIDRRGVYLWDGSGKPTYASRPIEFLFSENGDLDKTSLYLGTAAFFRPLNQIIWYLSSYTVGQQQYVLKMDLRLTLPMIQNFLGEKIIDGVFIQGKTTNFISACRAILSPINNENRDYLIAGDNIGNTYKMYFSTIGTGNDTDFSYGTAHLDQERPGITKRYHKVIAWVDNVGNYNLQLDYWSDYRTLSTASSTKSVAIGTTSTATSIWDIGYWDVAFWDSQLSALTPVVFNLDAGSVYNNNEGVAIKLQFSNAASGQPVTINAFSILYTEIGVRQ